MRDITLRGLDVLKAVAVIAAEDTRVTARLLQQYGITSKLTPLHEHNEARAVGPLLARLEQGESIALVSDAGTPGISDPGARLVAAARCAGVPVTSVPGANAAVAALSVSGFTTRHFLFYGFLSSRAAQRRSELASLAPYPFPLVFFEAPHRIVESMEDMAAVLGGERSVVIARELTKMFETVHGCELAHAAAWLAGDENRRKGEFVLVVEGAAASREDGADVKRTLEILLSALPVKQAVALAVRLTGEKRNRLYDLALQLKASGAAGCS